VIELDRTERRVFESRGIVHHAMGNFRHAVDDFTSAIDINPEAPDSYTLRGQVLTHRPHLHRDRACPCHICTETGLTPPTSAPGLGSPLPHLHRDWACPCHICTGTGVAPSTSAPGPGLPLPHLHRDWAHPCSPATSAPGLQAHLSLSKFELGIEDFDKVRRVLRGVTAEIASHGC
jgi:hypothetical protein